MLAWIKRNSRHSQNSVPRICLLPGLATMSGGSPLELNSASFQSHAVDGAFFVLQDLFIFTFAAVSLDFCFKSRFISPFPIERD